MISSARKAFDLEFVDLAQWPRREHFQFFSGLSFPFYNLTTTLDVSRLHAYVKARDLSFYYSLIYVTLSVMNELPDFLYKIRGGQIVKHDRLDPSFVVLEEETRLLKIVNVPFVGTMEAFCAGAAEKAAAQRHYFPAADQEARDDLVYISCTPWFSFTSFTNEMNCDPDDSIPRVTWGKFEQQGDRLTLPYSVQLNHRLLDGWHLGQLIQGVQRSLDRL